MNDYLIVLLVLFILFVFYILVINLEKYFHRRKQRKRAKPTYLSRRQKMKEYNKTHRNR